MAATDGDSVHGLTNSIAKRVYSLRLDSARSAREWQGEYWEEEDGVRVIRCRNCRKFDSARERCSVPFGSPVRKCVTAAAEANLNSLAGKSLLEIGFGKHSIPRRLVTSAGGTWTGIEPMLAKSHEAAIGGGGYGHVGSIPFADETFDVVTGIQSFEHWDEPLPDPELETGHESGLREVHRVLKPGGSIYFDAPIHLHGHEMFIAGDVPRIRGLFDTGLWSGVTFEKWREDYEPLERYPTPQPDLDTWPEVVSSYPQQLLDDIYYARSVWLLTVTASKV